MSGMNIEFAEGWESVAPRADAPSLVVEADGRLVLQNSDFSSVRDFGAVGPVDCPLAYDAATRTAFRYVSPSAWARSDYSELRAFNLMTGESRSLLRLPLNQWVLWLLEWLDSPQADSGQLFGLVATDRPADDRVVIEHRLFALKGGELQPRMRPICRDAYRPLAFSRQRRELVFAGAEGIYLVNLRGVRVATFPSSDSTGQGAAFDPSGSGRVVIGGDGLFLWDVDSHQSTRLTRLGRHPVWSPHQNGIWYRESSSDLCFYDFDTEQSTKVLEVANNRNPELWYARPVEMTKCGRYLAVAVTGKNLKGISRKANAKGSRERVFVHDHELYILDLEKRVYWSREGFANHLCWAE
ncbi:MAG: TolB family protein [Opitutaceae bacterium]